MFVRSVLAVVAASSALVLTSAVPALALTQSPSPSSSADGRVEKAIEVGTDLFFGGTFSRVDGTVRTRLAALDAATGSLDPSFNVSVNGEVKALAASGTTLYIGGIFTTVGSEARSNVAAIDTSTGTVLPFSASTSAAVESIDVVNGVVYLGGKFRQVNGTARRYLAAVNASNGSLVSAFKPQPSSTVYAVKADSNGSLYVGGNFQTIGGVARNYVAQLGLGGAVLDWNAGLPFDTQVFDVTATSGHVYLATGGHLPSGNSIYSIDATNGAKEWQVSTDGNVHAVEFTNGSVYAGGHFNYLKPCDSSGVCTETDVRKKALAIDATSGTAQAWNPQFNSSLGIFDLTAAAGNLYALGDFTTVNGISQPHIARFLL